MSRRLFVALVPPEPVRDEVRRAGDHLRRALPHLQARFTDPAAVHLTLAFLGQVAEAAVPAVTRAVDGAARTSRRTVARTAALGAFPNATRPSVLWLGLDDDEGLARLQRALAEALSVAGGPPESKRFVPHLTLARVKTLRGVDRVEVGDALAAFEAGRASWQVEEVVLFESELRPEGARHTRLLGVPLAPARPDAPPG